MKTKDENKMTRSKQRKNRYVKNRKERDAGVEESNRNKERGEKKREKKKDKQR